MALANMDGEPNVKLGWWWLGNQTGVALADHLALAALPHEGFLSPLLFRLVRHGGLPLPCPGLKEKDMLMVGECGTNCVLHVGQAKVGSGKMLMAFGLGLADDKPEAAAMLDGFLDYAASEQFMPESEITMESRQ